MQKSQYLDFNSQSNRLLLSGNWTVGHVSEIQSQLNKLSLTNKKIIIDGKGITSLDTAGGWLINQLTSTSPKPSLENFSDQHTELLKFIETNSLKKQPPARPALSWVERVGKQSIIAGQGGLDYLNFVGKLGTEALQLLLKPHQWRWKELTAVIDKTGFQALMIVALLSFMIGVVITYQMGVQLRTYGANVYVVDLLGLSVLREFGPLLTAIMVAGRTGSAYTAQLGIMKINQEIDALSTMGIAPEDILLLPKILGLLIAMPLLTIWADVFGVIGGIFMSNNMLDITLNQFLHRFHAAVPVKNLIIGLGKAPVFALIIASIGCFQGMKVQGNANSLGTNTTRSVVLGIFFIILADAAFSIIFSKLKI